MSGADPSIAFTEVTRGGSPRPVWAQPELRGQRLGRYLVLGVLGRGGMGVVVEAHDEVLDRSVALKLLDPSATRRSEIRLLREAQALARLSHPNVVQVYDIGEIDGQTFIAMELVRGRTLRAWGREPQPWRQAVAVYLQAARGLAAAHDKGLVHRDFKPDNCIIDDAGRVRVLDFGLARELVPPGASSPTEPPRASDDDEPAGHVLGESLTRTGVLMGTLGYMSFEQLQGCSADAYSDQYSFCVSLYEALYGEAPYAGRSAASLLSAMFSDSRRPAPPGIVVPRRLARALWRGLSREPTKRWPSMPALIGELEALSNARRSRVVAGAVGVSLTLVGAFGFGLTREAEDPCPSLATALAGTWDADARQRVEAALAAHGPADPSLRPRVIERLDHYATAWATLTRESCRATFVVRRQSTAQLERRTRCLERHRNRFMATVAAFGDAEDAEQLAQAMVLPFRLPALEPCTEAELAEPEAAPGRAARGEHHAALQRSIDEASTLREAGRLDEAMALAEAALAEAQGLGDPSLVAEALECLGRVQTDAGSMIAAQATLEEAIVAAGQAGDHPTAARAWLSLLFVATMRGNHAEARHYALPARATVEHTGDDVLRAWLLNNLGILSAEQGSPEEGLRQLEEALALKQRVLGAGHVDVGIAWLNLGGMLTNSGAHPSATEALAQARAIFEATVGEAHPLTTYALASQCHAEHGLGHTLRAIELCEQALARFAPAHRDPQWESRTRFGLAEALWSAGREAEARAMAELAARLVRAEDPPRAASIEQWIATHTESSVP